MYQINVCTEYTRIEYFVKSMIHIFSFFSMQDDLGSLVLKRDKFGQKVNEFIEKVSCVKAKKDLSTK